MKYFLSMGYHVNDGENRHFCQIASKDKTKKDFMEMLYTNGIKSLKTIEITKNEYLNLRCNKMDINAVILKSGEHTMFYGDVYEIDKINITYYLLDGDAETLVMTMKEFKTVFKNIYLTMLDYFRINNNEEIEVPIIEYNKAI